MHTVSRTKSSVPIRKATSRVGNHWLPCCSQLGRSFLSTVRPFSSTSGRASMRCAVGCGRAHRIFPDAWRLVFRKSRPGGTLNSRSATASHCGGGPVVRSRLLRWARRQRRPAGRKDCARVNHLSWVLRGFEFLFVVHSCQ